METMQKSPNRNNRHILRTIFVAVICLAAGFLICRYITTQKSAYRKFTLEDIKELKTDSVIRFQRVSDSILRARQQAHFDSLQKVSNMKDSLMNVRGKIISTRFSFPLNSPEYRELDLLYLKVDEMIDSANLIILRGALEMLKPTNLAFKDLIKDINDKKQSLEKIADRYASISDIVKSITNIFKLGILGAPASPPTT